MDSTDRDKGLLESCFAKNPGLKSRSDKFHRARARAHAMLQAQVAYIARPRALARNASSENGDLDHADDTSSLGFPIWMIREGVVQTLEQLQEAASTSSNRQVGMKSEREKQGEEDVVWDEVEAAAAANYLSIGKKAKASTSSTGETK